MGKDGVKGGEGKGRGEKGKKGQGRGREGKGMGRQEGDEKGFAGPMSNCFLRSCSFCEVAGSHCGKLTYRCDVLLYICAVGIAARVGSE